MCAERIRLVEQYTAAASALFAKASVLSSKQGVAFQRGLAASKAVRVECIDARQQLHAHVAEHRCSLKP